MAFDRRVESSGIKQIRTRVKAPGGNAITGSCLAISIRSARWMNPQPTTIDGDLIEALAKGRRIRVQRIREFNLDNASPPNQYWEACITCINGLPDNPDQILAPYKSCRRLWRSRRCTNRPIRCSATDQTARQIAVSRPSQSDSGNARPAAGRVRPTLNAPALLHAGPDHVSDAPGRYQDVHNQHGPPQPVVLVDRRVGDPDEYENRHERGH